MITEADGGVRAYFPSARVRPQPVDLGRAPYAILTVVQLAAAAFGILYAAVTPDAALRTADLVAAGLMVVLAAFSWFLAPRMADGFGLGVSLGVLELVTVLGMLAIHNAEGQMTVGLGLVLLGVFAGWFRPRPRLYLHLGLLAGGFAATAALNPHLSTNVTYVVLISILIGVPLAVASLADRQRDLAMRDGLTGVLNRHGLDLFAAPLLAGAARAKVPVTIGLLDLDDFKGLNDSRGHLAGDEALVEIATAWSREVRASDLVARYGGDEFALVLPGATPVQAEALVARVRARTGIRFSVGLATWIPGEDLYAALARADEALFEVKRRRRATADD